MTHRGASRPLRAGGLALLGVAAVAAVIGTASAVSGDSDDQAERPPDEPGTSETAGPGGATSEPGGGPATESPESSATTERPESSGADESAAPDAPTAPTEPAKPSAGDGGTPTAGGGKGDADKSVSVRVYNNSNVQGLATRAADDLRANGWNVVSTGNYSEGRIYTTTAYYRPGTNERSAAEAIAAEFGMRVEPRFSGIADSSSGVIVIVTKDYSSGK